MHGSSMPHLGSNLPQHDLCLSHRALHQIKKIPNFGRLPIAPCIIVSRPSKRSSCSADGKRISSSSSACQIFCRACKRSTPRNFRQSACPRLFTYRCRVIARRSNISLVICYPHFRKSWLDTPSQPHASHTGGLARRCGRHQRRLFAPFSGIPQLRLERRRR